MSVLRRRATPTTCESSASGFAFGSSARRWSLMSANILDSSAGSSACGSRGGALAHPAQTSASSAATTGFMRLLHDLEQAGGAHAGADAHRHHAVLGLAPAAFNKKVAGHAGARHTVGMPD